MTSATSAFDTSPGPAPRDDQLEPSGDGRTETNLAETERRASAVGGAALLALGLLRRSLPLAALGGYLAYRGKTGHCELYRAIGVNPAGGEEGRTATFSKTITINRSREDVYRLFQGEDVGFGAVRGLERGAPEDADAGPSRWYLRPSDSLPFRWEVEIADQRRNERILWRAAASSPVRLLYSVELEDAPRDRGTRVRVKMSCLLPGGGPGAAVAKALGSLGERQLDRELRQAKQYLETGEIPTTEGQPSGRAGARRLPEKVERLAS